MTLTRAPRGRGASLSTRTVQPPASRGIRGMDVNQTVSSGVRASHQGWLVMAVAVVALPIVLYVVYLAATCTWTRLTATAEPPPDERGDGKGA